ncbi:hypothetical protein [Actinoplanes sp. NPDC051411]|uniref:hypothetical protein n=1 Tax=Actinoplanes sp. NPDC051411 TaxID=3155522 RepID=UPI0034348FDD
MNASPVNGAAPSTAEDLSYQLSASPGNSRSVKVSAKASGQPEPRLTYWFMLEVDYGKGYVEYYPRWTMTGRSKYFDVKLPNEADTEYSRIGQVYGLNSTQNTQAEAKLGRQNESSAEDFFTKAIGRPVSNAVKLPY